MADVQQVYIRDSITGETYFLKAVVAVNPSYTTRVTAYPTSEGTAISDYAYKDPNTLSLSVKDSVFISAKNITRQTDSEAGIRVSVDAFKEQLKTWNTASTRLIVQTRFERFANMVLTSMSWSEGDNNLGIFEPNLSFTEVRIATINTVSIGPFESNVEEVANSSEVATNEKSATATTSDLLGSVSAGATIGALGGAAIGHPFIGGVVGALGGVIKGAGDYFGWW